MTKYSLNEILIEKTTKEAYKIIHIRAGLIYLIPTHTNFKTNYRWTYFKESHLPESVFAEYTFEIEKFISKAMSFLLLFDYSYLSNYFDKIKELKKVSIYDKEEI